MPITVIVRSAAGSESRLTFDGTQRIVIGRGPGCDVRVPDPSVSLRHASLRAQRADFVLVDEGSHNGTFVGGARVSPHTSRLVRSGDLARIGRVWLELRIDQSPVTRDVGAATRDLALALVGEALDAAGGDRTLRIAVVEGPDQGADLALELEDREYALGRAPESDLALADPDASREHARVVRRGGAVTVRDLGTRNGTWLAGARLPPGREVAWRPPQVLQIARTVLSLRDPLSEALAHLEQEPDEPFALEEPPPGPPSGAVPVASPPAPAPPGPLAPAPSSAPTPRAKGAGWSPIDLAVMSAAAAILALSIAGLVWLLRG